MLIKKSDRNVKKSTSRAESEEEREHNLSIELINEEMKAFFNKVVNGRDVSMLSGLCGHNCMEFLAKEIFIPYIQDEA